MVDILAGELKARCGEHVITLVDDVTLDITSSDGDVTDSRRRRRRYVIVFDDCKQQKRFRYCHGNNILSEPEGP